MNIGKVMQNIRDKITTQEFQAIQDHIDYLEALVASMESVNLSRSAVYEYKRLRQ